MKFVKVESSSVCGISGDNTVESLAAGLIGRAKFSSGCVNCDDSGDDVVDTQFAGLIDSS